MAENLRLEALEDATEHNQAASHTSHAASHTDTPHRHTHRYTHRYTGGIAVMEPICESCSDF